jgi:hypothetical protein
MKESVQRLLTTGAPLPIQSATACVEEPAWLLSSPVLVELARCDPAEAGPAVPDLVDWFAKIDDPRHGKWVEHPVAAVLALCAGAVVAGNSSFTAIAGWVADVPADLLAVVYARCGSKYAPPLAPSKSTVWRVVTEIDPGQVDAAISAWLLDRAEKAGSGGGNPATGEHPAAGRTRTGRQNTSRSQGQ